MAATCVPVTNGQIALASTDMGHEDQNDGSWAANNPQAQIDFAYRAEHVLAQRPRRSSRSSTARLRNTPISTAARMAGARR